MDAAEVIPSKVLRQGCLYPFGFLLNALVSLASLRMCIRMVKFWRSICDAEIKLAFGDPATGLGKALTNSPGLYLLSV